MSALLRQLNICPFRSGCGSTDEERLGQLEAEPAAPGGIEGGGGGTLYIGMIGMLFVFFRGQNQQFGIFLGVFREKSKLFY